MTVHPSARKHGVEPADVLHAASAALFVSELDEDNPQRELRLGFDRSGRLLELVVPDGFQLEFVEEICCRTPGVSGWQ